MDEITEKKETIRISSDGLYRGVTVHTPFPLESSDFLKLTKVNSLLPIWAHTFFTATSVFLITVLAKWLNHKYLHGVETVTNTEAITLSILIVLAVLFEVLYITMPSEKKKTISIIEKHFIENRPKAAGFGNE